MKVIQVSSALFAAALLVLAGATGARWYDAATRRTTPEPEVAIRTPAPAQAPAPAAATKPAPVKAIELESLKRLLALLDPQSRQFLLASDEKFGQFVQQEAKNQSVLAAAYANDVERSEPVKLLMQRAGQKALVEAYLTDVVRRNLDPKFPTEAQVQEFYDKNPDAFKVPERIHLWQVFIPAEESASKSEQANAKALASQIAEALRKGKADFAAQARKYSRHNESRLNGGYMGLLRLDELLPPVREAVGKADEGDIVGPVRTKAGYHVLKLGAKLPGATVSLEEAKPRVIAQMQREAAMKIRQTAIEKLAERFPVAVDTGALAAWRKTLLEADFGQSVAVSPEAPPTDAKVPAKPGPEEGSN